MIKIEEDWIFLQDQRDDRKMVMGEEDLDFKTWEEKRKKRKWIESLRESIQNGCIYSRTKWQWYRWWQWTNISPTDFRTEKWQQSQHRCWTQIFKISPKETGHWKNYTLEATSVSASSAAESASLVTPKKRCLIDDPLFVASLDRTKTTPREAMHIVAQSLKSAGIAIDDIILSTSSIYRARKAVRISLADDQRFSQLLRWLHILMENFYQITTESW